MDIFYRASMLQNFSTIETMLERVRGLGEAIALHSAETTINLDLLSNTVRADINYRQFGHGRLINIHSLMDAGTRKAMLPKLVPLVQHLALSEAAIGAKQTRAWMYTVPTVLKEIILNSGITPDAFLHRLKHKATTWNDGIEESMGRKVKNLGLAIKTSGSFEDRYINLDRLQFDGHTIELVHAGSTPKFNIGEHLPGLVQEGLKGQCLTSLIEAPSMKPYEGHFIIKGFEIDYRNNMVAACHSLEKTVFGELRNDEKENAAAVEERLTAWAKAA